MRSILPIALLSGCLVASCKKNDNNPPAPSESTFVQLQKAEMDDETIDFRFNDQHQLTKLEITDNENGQLSQYTTFTYENGLPAKAEFYSRYGNEFHKYSEYHYKHDAQKKLSYIAIGHKTEDGSYNWTDTLDLIFNAANKLSGIKFRMEGAALTEYQYDSKGNFIRTDNQVRYGDYVLQNKYQFRYDNNVNPFSVNGLGLLLFTVQGFDYFTQGQLFSSNNPVYEENAYTRTQMNENNQQIGLYESTNNIEYTNTPDEQGGLKLVKLRHFGAQKQNGNQTGSYDNTYTHKYTCIKKQQ